MHCNILITGSNSPSGVEAVKQYCKDAHIYTLSRTKSASKNHIQVDLSKNERLFLKELQSFELPYFDKVINMASATPGTTKDSSTFYKVNLINQIQLFDRLPLSDDCKILNFSSSSIYRRELPSVRETSDINTSNHYGMSKLLFEQHLSSLAKKHPKASILSTRIPVLFGPNQCKNFIGNWISNLKQGNKVSIFNPNSDFNACTSIYDIFRLFEFFISSVKPGHLICNVGVSNKIKMKNLFEQVCDAIEVKGQYETIDTQDPCQLYLCDRAEQLGFRFASIEQVIYENLIRREPNHE